MTEEQEDRIANGLAIVKIVAFFAMITILGVTALRAEAATYGNATGETPTFLTQPIRGIVASQNTLNGVMQTFTPTEILYPSTLELWISKQNTPADETTVRLCIGATTTPEDPCTGAGFVLQTWHLDSSEFPAYDPNPPGALPILLTMDPNIPLYPTNQYSIVIERVLEDATNLPRVGYNVGDFSAGEAYVNMNIGSCGNPQWRDPSATSPAGCSNTDSNDFMFRFTYLDNTDQLTIQANQNGNTVKPSGSCVMSGDLPAGWTLSSNLVNVFYQDTSNNGIGFLRQYACDEFYNAPAPLFLWNGTFNLVASQPGNPVTFSATTSVTVSIEGNPISSPTAFLDDLDCSQETLEDKPACYLNAVGNVFHNMPPLLWWHQVETAVASASNAPAFSATITPMNSSPITLLSSSSTSTGIVGELNASAEVGGYSWREMEELILWLIFVLYCLLWLYRLLNALK